MGGSEYSGRDGTDQRTPFEGMGKPEPLKHGLSGYWSRRINDEHLLIAQLCYHYLY